MIKNCYKFSIFQYFVVLGFRYEHGLKYTEYLYLLYILKNSPYGYGYD